MNKNEGKKPAIEGGTPVRADFLSFYRPSVDEGDVESVVDAIRSGWLTLGPRTIEFERKLEAYLGAKHVLALSSCSEAMFLALKALEVGPGDEVITSALTFASTVQAIIHTGAEPVLADIEEETFGPSPADIKRKITKRTKAIMPVHYGGQACLLDEILDIAGKNGVAVVEDAAHALGASCSGRKVGSFGNATAFSFYATKNITTGEGGAIATNDDDLDETVRKLSFHGISRDAWKRYADRGSWYYEVEVPGFKSNMSDLSASLGMSQLRKLDDFLRKKNEIAEYFTDNLRGSVFFQLPTARMENYHTWHLFVIRLNLDKLKIDRDYFIKALAAENIGSSVHFIPIYRHPFFAPYAKEGETFPACEDFFSRCISLPIFAGMNEPDQRDVVTALKNIALHYAK
jgi:dTDP-4-amino-4,6-dideoxygalactose transaminase